MKKLIALIILPLFLQAQDCYEDNRKESQYPQMIRFEDKVFFPKYSGFMTPIGFPMTVTDAVTTTDVEYARAHNGDAFKVIGYEVITNEFTLPIDIAFVETEETTWGVRISDYTKDTFVRFAELKDEEIKAVASINYGQTPLSAWRIQTTSKGNIAGFNSPDINYLTYGDIGSRGGAVIELESLDDTIDMLEMYLVAVHLQNQNPNDDSCYAIGRYVKEYLDEIHNAAERLMLGVGDEAKYHSLLFVDPIHRDATTNIGDFDGGRIYRPYYYLSDAYEKSSRIFKEHSKGAMIFVAPGDYTSKDVLDIHSILFCPVNSGVRISYKLTNFTNQTYIKIYDVLGREIKDYKFYSQGKGEYSVNWYPNDKHASGTYIVTIEAGGYKDFMKVSYLK